MSEGETSKESVRAAVRMAQSAMSAYPDTCDRAALRCALADAAALCDAFARDVLLENLSKRGHRTKRGRELAVVAERCGNAIWAMREQITVPK